MFRAPDRIPELMRRLVGHPHVVPAMRRDFMASPRDRTNQLGLPLSDPTKHEERGPDVMPSQQLE